MADDFLDDPPVEQPQPVEQKTAYDWASSAPVIQSGELVSNPLLNELQIDIDEPSQYAVFEDCMAILKRETPGQLIRVLETPSKSGKYGHVHIRVLLPWTVTPWERIAWQAALGSDSRRELLSCLRARAGNVQPTRLVESDAIAKQVDDWYHEVYPVRGGNTVQ